MKIMKIIKYPSQYFLIILGLLNALIASNVLRIFLNNSSYFANEHILLLFFYFLTLILSLLAFIANYYLKIPIWLILNTLITLFIYSFLVPHFIDYSGVSISDPLKLYVIIFILGLILYLIINFFYTKKTSIKFLLKIGIIISFSTIIVDCFLSIKYLNILQNSDKFTNHSLIPKKNTFENSSFNSIKADNVFYIMFDQMSPKALLEESNLKEEVFFKKINDGIYFENTYSNGEHTALSILQHLNGKLDHQALFYHHLLLKQKIKSNYFMYQRRCNERYPLTCYGKSHYLNSLGYYAKNNFFIKKMFYALELKFYFPISSFISKIDQVSNNASNIDLVKLQLEKIKSTINKKTKNTFNFIYFLPPHNPYLYNRTCKLNKDSSSISIDNKDFKEDRKLYLDQIHCANLMVLNLIEFLKKNNLYDNSLIIITSDHSDIGLLDHMKKHTKIESIRYEYLQKIKKHQNTFNEAANTRSLVPLWVKPPKYKNGLAYSKKRIFSLDLPVTTLETMGIKNHDLPGLNLIDPNNTIIKFNKRIPVMTMYGQYGKKTFTPFTYLALKKNDWIIIDKKEAMKLEKEKFKYE